MKNRGSRRGYGWLAGAFALGVMVAGCGIVPPPAGTETRTLRLEFNGLESLGADFEYEGWIIVNGAPVSTGRFDIDGMGAPVPAEFEIDEADAMAATMFVLTIEPAQNDPPEPADTHVLAGNFMGDAADLEVGHAAALGDDFGTAAGLFVLNTPSTAGTDDDFDQGIWWLEVVDGQMVAGLDLPELPAGWMYEGWVVGPGGPITTGKFLAVDEADDDGAGPTSGADGFPPFPGQDYIMPPEVLIGYVAVISVEPDPDDSAAPFALKPLVDMDIADLGIGVAQMMVNQSAMNNPTGTATIGQ